MTYIDGMASGLDTTTIIRQLMQIERQPQTRLTSRRASTEKIASTIGGIRTDVSQLRSLAVDLRLPGAWQGLKASTSSEALVATARTGQVTGSLDVRVVQTASAAAIYSNEAVALDTVIASGGGPLLGAGDIGALGFDAISGNGIPAGDLPLTVTQSTSAATITAGEAPGGVTITAGSNDELSVVVDGAARTLTVGPGVYGTADELAAAVSTAIGAAGLAGELRADVDSGKLRLSTVNEGSARTLEVGDGSGRAALGFGPNGAPLQSVGSDGTVTFNGDTATVTDTKPPASVVVGNLTATLGGPLRAGEAQVHSVDIGSGTLGEVIQAVNAATGLGFRAAAVNVGTGYRLQLTAKETGAASTVAIDRSAFTYSGFATLTEGRDAQLVVDGVNPYTITSSSNTFADLLPGVDVTAVRTTVDPVRLTVAGDTEARADTVQSFVDQLNTLLAKVDAASNASPEASARGALAGSSELRRVREGLVTALTREIGGNFSAVAGVGITMQRDGTVGFDRSRFLDAVEENPEAVQALFMGAVDDAGDGVMDRVVTAAEYAASSTSGYLKTAEDGARSRVDDYTRQIEGLEQRYIAKEQYYRRMFSSLETALSGLQNQSNWLAGQLGGSPQA